MHQLVARKAVAVWIVLAISSFSFAGSSAPQVKTRLGTVEGKDDGKVKWTSNLPSYRLAEAREEGMEVSIERLKDRGLLHKGMKADVVVFDPKTIRDVSTYEDPHHFSEGISNVIVNGTPVLRDNAMTAALPGRVLRRAPVGAQAPSPVIDRDRRGRLSPHGTRR